MNLDTEIIRQFSTMLHAKDFPTHLIFGESPYNPDFFDNFNLTPNILYPWAEICDQLHKVFFTETEAYATVPPLIAWGTHSILLTSFHDFQKTLFWYTIPKHPAKHYPVFGLLP